MGDLVERRWTRYAHDRVYVTTAAGLECRHIDLKARRVIAADPAFVPALEDCLRRWCGDATISSVPPAAPPAGDLPPPQPLPQLPPPVVEDRSVPEAATLPARASTMSIDGPSVVEA